MVKPQPKNTKIGSWNLHARFKILLQTYKESKKFKPKSGLPYRAQLNNNIRQP